MDKLAYTALSAVQSQSVARAAITNELANVSTVGFKKSFQIASSAVKIDGPGHETRFQPGLQITDVINLTPGTPMSTGQPLDIAMNDQTVLGIQAEDGDIAFTRRGDLKVSPSGVLENALGELVMGEGGPISVPVGNLISISPDGTVFAQLPTEPEAAAVAVGQLMLRDASQTQLVRRPDGLFEPRAEAFKGQDFPSGPMAASVMPGMLEGSNVNPVGTMIKMLDFSRQFEMQLKLVKETQSIDEAGSTMMRLP
ncbi:flagellar basal body rod protein FlgF [SAR92 clade bacterium H455]|uniref:Flagellar basal-body rod protein FlgF n=1 Tax=SAR92 clade bacterium H455 TaxID=2974818 RepID=A0ABY5TMS5_9GAMM|nr:flagellar basal body rod protein FlgF [SAR92 clade bacterium H455]